MQFKMQPRSDGNVVIELTWPGAPNDNVDLILSPDDARLLAQGMSDVELTINHGKVVERKPEELES